MKTTLFAALIFASVFAKDSVVWKRRGGHAISGDSVKCNGKKNLFYEDVDECFLVCSKCNRCVAYVDNKHNNPPFCVFKRSIANLYKRKDRSKDTYVKTIIETTCADAGVCCPNGYACMRPRGGGLEDRKCVGRADSIVRPIECEPTMNPSPSPTLNPTTSAPTRLPSEIPTTSEPTHIPTHPPTREIMLWVRFHVMDVEMPYVWNNNGLTMNNNRFKENGDELITNLMEELNSIYAQTNIGFFLREWIVEEPDLLTKTYTIWGRDLDGYDCCEEEGTWTFEQRLDEISRSGRDASGRSDNRRLYHLHFSMNPNFVGVNPMNTNTIEVYLWPYMGSTSQGNAGSCVTSIATKEPKCDGNLKMSTWSDKRGPIAERLITEDRSNFVLGSLGQTLAHEIGHQFGLSHDGVRPNLMRSDGYGLEDWQIETMEQIASARSQMLSPAWSECHDHHECVSHVCLGYRCA